MESKSSEFKLQLGFTVMRSKAKLKLVLHAACINCADAIHNVAVANLCRSRCHSEFALRYAHADALEHENATMQQGIDDRIQSAAQGFGCGNKIRRSDHRSTQTKFASDSGALHPF